MRSPHASMCECLLLKQVSLRLVVVCVCVLAPKETAEETKRPCDRIRSIGWFFKMIRMQYFQRTSMDSFTRVQRQLLVPFQLTEAVYFFFLEYSSGSCARDGSWCRIWNAFHFILFSWSKSMPSPECWLLTMFEHSSDSSPYNISVRNYVYLTVPFKMRWTSTTASTMTTTKPIAHTHMDRTRVRAHRIRVYFWWSKRQLQRWRKGKK